LFTTIEVRGGRWDVLSSATYLYRYSPFLEILLTFALEDDELLGDDWRTQEIKKMIENPEQEKEFVNAFLFLTSDDPTECRCALPHHPYFSNPEPLSAARSRLKEFRQKGYCPLHRHPVLVDFVEMLSRLLSGKLGECMKYVDLRRANMAVPGEPLRIGLEYHYEHYIVQIAKAINRGLIECCDEDTDVDEENEDGKQYKYWECKGKSPVHTSFLSLDRTWKSANGIGCRFRHWIQYVSQSMPVAEITGAKNLLPFMLDVIQLQEMHRIRMTPKDQHYGEHTFWWNMALLSDRVYSANQHRWLRDTMPVERLGPVRYDLGTLGQNMLDRFKFCRDELGMNDFLPEKGDHTSGV